MLIYYFWRTTLIGTLNSEFRTCNYNTYLLHSHFFIDDIFLLKKGKLDIKRKKGLRKYFQLKLANIDAIILKIY